MLALNAFNGIDFSLRHAIVMCTYLIAEWFLISDCLMNRQFVPLQFRWALPPLSLVLA
ncbi:MAG: hypothetical protein J6X22_07835 [Muribaculaceae bacterium]|nr:hypothetical protein [Muribaculaceae bacterium]